MAVRVIDASALAALLFSEPEAQAVVDSIGRDTLAAPRLLAVELASVCYKKLKQYPKQRTALLAGYDLLDRMAIEWVDPALRPVIELAEQTGLTVYDAMYLELARELNAELITLDQDLARAHRSFNA